MPIPSAAISTPTASPCAPGGPAPHEQEATAERQAANQQQKHHSARSLLIFHIPRQRPHQPPSALQCDVEALGAVADVEPGVAVMWLLAAHQGELRGGGAMVDGTSLIGGALQSDAGHEG
jgi:hypothetical protein